MLAFVYQTLMCRKLNLNIVINMDPIHRNTNNYVNKARPTVTEKLELSNKAMSIIKVTYTNAPQLTMGVTSQPGRPNEVRT